MSSAWPMRVTKLIGGGPLLATVTPVSATAKDFEGLPLTAKGAELVGLLATVLLLVVPFDEELTLV